MHRRIENIRKKPPLFAAIFKAIPYPDVHEYHISVGTRRAIGAMARVVVPIMKETKEEHTPGPSCHLLPLDSLSKFPKRMASGLETHLHANSPSLKFTVGVGDVNIAIFREGNEVLAASGGYYPKSYINRKYIRGINAAFFEAKILKHLQKTEGITHVAAQDGARLHFGEGQLGLDSKERQNQLIARGLDPLKTYPVKEWIERLRSTPDYSRIKK